MNTQQSNQFINYQNYQHEQLMHHQYFEDNAHGQSYNFVPYPESFSAPAPPPISEQVPPHETFPSIQSNELYEFLPEEIFQLDQPILKSESQPFPLVNVSTTSHSLESLQMPFPSHAADITSTTSHSFLDLSSGQIQTNTKYPTAVESFSSEINNNSSYQPNISVENLHLHPKISEVNAYSYHVNQDPRLNCSVESEKILKRKHADISDTVKQNVHNYHANQPLFPKRENSSCLLQQNSGYFPSDLYATFPAKPNDYRTMEKFNYITNN